MPFLQVATVVGTMGVFRQYCSRGCNISSQDFFKLCKQWRLPFDIQNAVDTTMAELCLMEGNSTTAISLYKSLSARLKSAREVQKDVKLRVQSKHPTLTQKSFDVSLLSSRWSKLFAFRVTYTLAIASALAGQRRAAMVSLLGIICTLPCEELQPDSFTVEKESKFRFKEISTETFVARCILDIIYIVQVGANHQLTKRGMRG
ncbi:hypothetical protein K493DRAFT_64997 [Basidiobolus meristosporus CBS 931.73]|uniref:Uncharacterized protein n=1 Tax=Basidiobolus meristosporus CBS 931.73 TaxID=1314790 RepID=A0A1Y1Z0H0_9FUNG|nr:hypothetical protein K493DRAFT_64997 [Basidiobolus meristosporus CBS 931.73]|eukprot:ORY03778.1 hypothetical protein K493DRAFT_64997 [Basidiobolus meristosporus CBS 931.73]